MHLSAAGKIDQRTHADLLVIPFWKGKKAAELATTDIGTLKKEIAAPIGTQDFKGKGHRRTFKKVLRCRHQVDTQA
jgi:hypothetical protein